ncbi:MAG TPA: GntR family transcriptional regulator [Streptosporangiaceae bacterium]
MIEFHLDARSGVSPYLQLIHQVRQALRLGLLSEGDQLPTVKDVVGRLAINPNTVLKAYRELEYEGLVAARAGVGTFVTRSLAGSSLAAHGPLRADLEGWLAKARAAGLDEESIEALFLSTFRAAPPASAAGADVPQMTRRK